MECLPNVCEAVTDTPHKKNPVVIIIRTQMTNMVKMVKIKLNMISDRSLMMLMMICGYVNLDLGPSTSLNWFSFAKP